VSESEFPVRIPNFQHDFALTITLNRMDPYAASNVTWIGIEKTETIAEWSQCCHFLLGDKKKCSDQRFDLVARHFSDTVSEFAKRGRKFARIRNEKIEPSESGSTEIRKFFITNKETGFEITARKFDVN
jgi:hypothetical protein